MKEIIRCSSQVLTKTVDDHIEKQSGMRTSEIRSGCRN